MLEIKNLSKSYKDKKVLENVNFQIQTGEVIALLGRNGSGKTTIVKSICGLIDPDDDGAEFLLDGESIGQKTYSRLGVVLEGTRNCHWKLTPIENARYFATVKQKFTQEVRERIDASITMLGLQEYRNTPVSKLSTGNKQKVSLLCALATDSDFLLLDEPTLGLDLEAIDSLKESLKNLAATHRKGMLITSHDLNFIEDICSRALVLEGGRIIYDGDLNEFRGRVFKYKMVVEVDQSLADQVSAAVNDCFPANEFAVDTAGSQIVVHFKNIDDAIKLVSQQYNSGVRFEGFSLSPVPLESAIRSIGKVM